MACSHAAGTRSQTHAIRINTENPGNSRSALARRYATVFAKRSSANALPSVGDRFCELEVNSTRVPSLDQTPGETVKTLDQLSPADPRDVDETSWTKPVDKFFTKTSGRVLVSLGTGTRSTAFEYHAKRVPSGDQLGA